MVSSSSKGTNESISTLRIKSNQWLHTLLKDKHFDTVLNLGCGTDEDKQGGYYFEYFSHRKMVFVDIKKTRITTCVADAAMLPFQNGVFDFVFCNWLLYKDYPYPPPVLDEIKRVIKPKGKVMISYWRCCSDTFRTLDRFVQSMITFEEIFTKRCTMQADDRGGIARLGYGTII